MEETTVEELGTPLTQEDIERTELLNQETEPTVLPVEEKITGDDMGI